MAHLAWPRPFAKATNATSPGLCQRCRSVYSSLSMSRLVAARQCHDFVGRHTWARITNKLSQPARWPRPVRLLDHNASISSAPEGNLAAWPYSQVITDRLRNRYLTLARNSSCHTELQSNTCMFYGNTDKMSTTADG